MDVKESGGEYLQELIEHRVVGQLKIEPEYTKNNVLELCIHPEQVQIFTPTPSTYSTLMYNTETNPWAGEKLFVEKNNRKERKTKTYFNK
ncbi:MAG: DUF3362 domain-containing protein [Ignavibacteriales bacterium]|nr:DUF3362 domain-containing protein [Ignavibacteriales bacterium]